MGIKPANQNVHIKPNIRTAIVYSVDDLFSYTVEIRQGDHSYFISKENQPIRFGNMEDARQAAIRENAAEAYLTLSKTYEEADPKTCAVSPNDRYDYSPVPLSSGSNNYD